MKRLLATVGLVAALAACAGGEQAQQEEQQPAAQMADTAHVTPDTAPMMGDTAMVRDTAHQM